MRLVALALGLLLLPGRQNSEPRQTRPALPVLAFPEPGMDDTAAYQGYQTRFYRDSKGNTVQIYLEPRGGRVVNLLADAANESVGFTVRDSKGHPARLTWGADAAEVTDSGSTRSLEYRLTVHASRISLGWFLLGSMRIERDFQYGGRHLKPFASPAFVVTEESLLVATVGRLAPEERRRHLDLLRASSVDELRSRLYPTLVRFQRDTVWVVQVTRPSLDGRNHLILELSADARETSVHAGTTTVSVRSRSGSQVNLAVRVTTDATPLTPLVRNEIFNRPFLEFLAAARASPDSMRYRRLEREVRGVELLSSKEKLMAGLPSFATYFGRDMMMSALMMRPIWSPAMAEHVIASVLRKLGPLGDVSHEEALGGQAIRENAVVYDSLITEYFRLTRGGRQQVADSLLGRGREALRDLQKTRENYHMIDDEFQLPVLVARYLGDSSLTAERKRGFLLDSLDGGSTRLALMLREMGLVSAKARPYTQNPKPLNLVSFPKRDATHWRSASWRDSDAGYAGGRFAMDINAIWVPQALEAISSILATLPLIGIPDQKLDSIAPELDRSPLGEYIRDPASLRRAIEVWRGARHHFEITLAPRDIEQRIRAKLAWLPATERSYWRKVMTANGEVRDSLAFLALSLDATGHPIPVVNTDPATGLFLQSFTKEIETGMITPQAVLRDVTPFVRAYPVGLFVKDLGPVVANDAYASREDWERFRDAYHSPRVVWGREVNLFFLGLANQIDAFNEAGQIKNRGLEPYVHALEDALGRTRAAVSASGLGHNELWSYRIKGGCLLPARYGTSADVQLWNTTDLAVQFVLSRLSRP